MASPDDFEVTFYGKGGHGASPETAINPIEMGRDFVSLTDVISREISKENIPCVISICSFHSGSCRNAIPETAVISGTFRTLTPDSRKQTAERIKQATEQIAQKYGGEFSLDLNLLYPPTINDPNMTNALIASSRELLGERNVLIGKHASMCGDDFAYFAEQIPSVYFHVGCGDNARCAPIHSPHFDLNEEAIRIAAETYVQFVLNYLSK